MSAPAPRTWPPPSPPRLPPGWHGVHRVDPAGRPFLLLRLRPLWRRAASIAAIAGMLLLAALTIVMYRHGERGPILCGMVCMVLIGSLGTAVIATTQDAWMLTPAGLFGGRAWVANGRFRRPPERVAALQLWEDEKDETLTVRLWAISSQGRHNEIFQEALTDARAEPFAAWLSTAAGIPILPRVPLR
ncbi:hypothetical protein OHA72_52530 [Dactylosporangium sp. NBC_01737]|uniref:hypothetical protein n=1 Tax=Dactylosporangium sp. NBC_01737 TaxID=2975959 RepID=UPI002E0F0484|nr:hypothetical protein OHA72_52530 [Dactylosporangium sp. NBC_01737]